ncbi:hypothetical protein ACWIGW_44320 [Nocardia brasiliensis]|uniref:hypothetical protein n=1 Tax=Streptomyces sp. NPDC056056 TaxID=3345698 RepID=UPI0035E19218
MARRLAVGMLKGGAAKSTTACHCAIWLSLLGLGPVLVAEADTDLMTLEWISSVRDKLLELGGGDRRHRVDVVDMTHGLGRLHEMERNYRYSVVDVEPKREKLLREALWRPDRGGKDGNRTDLIIPVKPYPADIRKLPQTLTLAAEVDQHNPVIPRVLLVQVRLSAGHAKEVPAQLAAAGIPIFRTMITLKESIGYSLNTTYVDTAYSDVLGELDIITTEKDSTNG